jgi:hypothetical protein
MISNPDRVKRLLLSVIENAVKIIIVIIIIIIIITIIIIIVPFSENIQVHLRKIGRTLSERFSRSPCFVVLAKYCVLNIMLE